MSTSVAVLGLGLIGGSIALRAAETGADCTVYDPDVAVRSAAREAGLHVVDSAAGLSGAQATVLAAPTTAVVGMLASGCLPPGDGLLIDVCSTKSSVVAAAGGLRDRFVGTHPMAGRADSGFTHAEPGLLIGATWVLTPSTSTPPARLTEALRFVNDTFEAGASIIGPDVHDQMVGLTSHLPHVLGQALVHRADDTNIALAAALAAGSFHGATRVVRGSPTFPAELVWSNRERVGDIITAVIADLAAVRDALRSGDRQRVDDWFTQTALDEARPETVVVDLPVSSSDVEVLLAYGESGYLARLTGAGVIELS